MAIPPMVAAAGQLTAATILLAPFAITTTAMEGADITWRRIGAILLLGVVGTGVAYVLNFRIIAELGATRASLVTYIIPIVAVAVGIVVLDEPFGWRIVAGGGLIIAGVFLVNSSGGVRRRGAIAVATALLAGLLAGCGSGGGGGSADGGCDPVRTEPLDRQYLVHVLPGAPDPGLPHRPADLRARTSPPHRSKASSPSRCPARSRSGCSRRAGCCSSTTGCPRADRTALEELAGEMVVVAPNPDLPDGVAVVATAWVTKQTCEAFVRGPLEAFAQDHAGKGPGGD